MLFLGGVQLVCLGLLGGVPGPALRLGPEGGRPAVLVGYDSLDDQGHHTFAETVDEND